MSRAPHAYEPALAPAEPSGDTSVEGPARDVLDTEAAGGLIIRGGALRLASYVSIVVLSLIPAVLLTRYLGAVTFGRYTTVISLVTIVTLVTDTGMSNLGIREYAVLEGVERDVVMRNLLGFRVVLTLFGVLLATLFAVATGYSAALLAGTVAASLSTVALVLQRTLSIPLAFELRIGAMSAIETVRQALLVVGIVALVALGAGVFPLLAVLPVAYVLLIPMTAALARERLSLRMGLRPAQWVALLRPTVSYSLATAVGAIYVYAAQIITSLATTPHQSGMFALSFRIFVITVAAPALLVSGAVPLLARAARDNRERLAYALQRIFEVSLIAGVATAIGMFACAPLIVKVLAGPKLAEYSGSIEVLRILGFAMIASFLIAGWGFALLSIKSYRALLLINGFGLLISCLLTPILASAYGARGAAYAVLGGESTLALGYVIALTYLHPELRPRPSIVPRILAASVPAAALAVTLDLPSLALTATVLIVYGLLLLLMRAIPSEIIEVIPGRAQRRRTSG
jgi:O-antigen/teichoic acid export membrane protein